MRQIGTIPEADAARRLGDHLLTLGITSRIDDRPAGSQVWIHREDQVEPARRELEEFLRDPANPRYQGVKQTAKELRKRREADEKKHIRNSIPLRGRWDYRPAERVPITLALVIASVVAGVFTELGSKRSGLLQTLSIAPSMEIVVGADDDDDSKGGRRVFVENEDLRRLRSGEIWRLVTPIFIHFGILHLLFNMFWLNDLGGMIEIRKGSLVFLGVVLTTAIASNLAQYSQRGPSFGGMSGVVYGLFGYIWVLNRYDPSSGMPLRPNTELILAIGFVLGLSSAFGPVANVAHLVGFASGLAIGAGSIGVKKVRGWRR